LNPENKMRERTPPGRDVGAPPAPRRIEVRDLLGEGRELRLLHDGQEYRLTITSKGKLILTK
jgi:hemin uptake protein HemP